MTILEDLLKSAADLAIAVFKNKLFTKNRDNKTYINVYDNLPNHLKYIANWSGRIQFYGLGEARNTDTESIQLSYHGTPRKFRHGKNHSEISGEDKLLLDNCNYLLIGDPGSGKTTTLKRLARKLLCESSLGTSDTYQYPILLRLKEIRSYNNLFFTIAEILGFSIKQKKHITIVERQIKEEDENGDEIKKTIQEKVITYSSVINNKPAEDFIANFLDESNSVILVDGLDEIDISFKDSIQADLSKLALKLSSSKIILTCRSGHYYDNKTIEGFNVLEILPLEADQIVSLASLWLENVDNFLDELNNLPYKDLADRPLLLSQLLFISNRYGSLPKRPKEVYQLIIELLLKDWDADRSIVRKSQYSDFKPIRKSEFLAELSFRLMYENRKLQFDSEDLINIYNKIFYKYELPYKESAEVAAEIETHTGIVVSSGFKKYEFSHLSLQEYLCADYIVRSPLTMEIKKLLEINPEPVAIAVALASDSTSWFYNLIIDNVVFDVLKVNMPSFLKRIVIEQPVFNIDETLGFAILNVFLSHILHSNDSINKIYKDFFNLKGINESVQILLKNTDSVQISRINKGGDIFKISYSLPLKSISGSKYTKSLIINNNTLTSFLKIFNIKL